MTTTTVAPPPRPAPTGRALPCLFLALLAVAGLPAERTCTAQQVVAQVPLLPPEAGMNPLGVTQILADPASTALFALHASGLTVVDGSGATPLLHYAFDLGGASAPVFQVLDPAARRLYVSDQGLRQVLVIDAATRALLARIDLGFEAGRLALDTMRGRLYVVEQATTPPSLQVAAIHTGSLAVSARVTLPTEGSRAAVNETTGRLYVTSEPSGLTYVLSPGLAIQRAIATGPTSTDIDVNPLAGTSGKVYVARTDGNVAVVDAATDTLLVTVPAAGAERVLANRASGQAYVTGLASGDLTVLDASDAPSTVAIGGTPAVTAAAGMAMDAAGTKLFVSDVVKLTRARVTVFDLTGPAPVRSGDAFTAGSGSTSMAYLEATQKLYLANSFTMSLSELDPVALTARTTALGAALQGLALSRPSSRSFIANAATNEAVVVHLASPLAPPVRTPVGELPVLGAIDTATVHVVSQNSKTITPLDAADGSPAGPPIGPLPNDVTLNLVFDRTVANGPKGFLINPDLAQALPTSSYLQVYKPTAVPPSLTGIGGNCITTPCFVATAEGVNEVTNRLYTAAVQVPALTVALAAYSTATERFVSPAITLPTPFDNPPFFLQVDSELGHNQVYVPAINTTAPARVVAVDTAASPATFTDLLTAGTPTAFALRLDRLYVAEATGVVEVWDTGTNALVSTIPTGGSPTAVVAPAGDNLLWVLNDALVPPAVQVYDALTGNLWGAITDTAYLAPGLGASGPIHALPGGRGTAINNLHGTVAVIDPTLPGVDLQITKGPLPDGVPGLPYPATTLLQTGGTGPFAWSLTSGRLPPGVSLDSGTGTLSGTPTAEGVFTFQVLLADQDAGGPAPRHDVEELQIQVLGLRLVTTALDAASCGPYRVQLLAAGGTPPYTWSVTGAPAWLDPSGFPGGLLQGTPSGPATCPPTLTVSVTDALGQTAMTDLCLAVQPGVVPPVGNELRAVKSSLDVVLSRSTPAPAPGAGFNVYRSPDAGGSWPRVPPGPLLPPSTATGDYIDAGAIAGPPIYWYQLRIVDTCGNEGP